LCRLYFVAIGVAFDVAVNNAVAGLAEQRAVVGDHHTAAGVVLNNRAGFKDEFRATVSSVFPTAAKGLSGDRPAFE
jgi:hypothetical protein